MPSTLANLTNADIVSIIGGIPTIDAESVGAETLDRFVVANDRAIIARYGEHPTDTDTAEYAERVLALAMLVKTDLFDDGDLAQRRKWLSRVGAYGGSS